MGSFLRSVISLLFATCSTLLLAHESAPAHDMAKMWAAQNARHDLPAVSVAADEQGTLWLARVADGHLLVSRSDDNGAHFSAGVVVNPVAETIRAEGQSRPRIAVRSGVIAVAWSQALPKVFSGHVRFSRSTDGSKTFAAPRTINDNQADIGHGFGTLALDGQGHLAIAWLDSRHRADAEAAGTPYAGSSIYYVLSADGGATFTPNLKLADHSCECCRIGLAIGPDGTALALWRHLFDGGARDFALAALRPGGTVLRASEDNWKIDGCPHHGGDLAIDAEGGAHLAWYSGAPGHSGLFYRRADGARLTAPLAFGNADAQAGYPTVFARGRAVHVAWREFDGARYRVMAMGSTDRGATWSPPRAVATTAGTADLPLFVVGATHALLAWSSTAEGVRILDLDAGP